MKVLVIGGGGREHAVCRKLSESKDVTELLCAPGNAGIARVARCIPDVKATDIDGIVALAKREKVDFVCVTPDDPLALGCVDRLEAEGIAAFGPTAYAAQMEASKIFSKNLLRKYGIPTAKCEIFTEMEKALAYLDTQSAPIVVKADGLALGKGVVVAATIDEAKQAVIEMMQGGKFGRSGARVLIEECMVGRVRAQPAVYPAHRRADGTRNSAADASGDERRGFHVQGCAVCRADADERRAEGGRIQCALWRPGDTGRAAAAGQRFVRHHAGGA